MEPAKIQRKLHGLKKKPQNKTIFRLKSSQRIYIFAQNLIKQILKIFYKKLEFIIKIKKNLQIINRYANN